VSDLFAAVGLVKKKYVAATAPDVCADASKRHRWRNQLSMISIAHRPISNTNFNKKTYLSITIQLQILIRLQHTTCLGLLFQILLGGRRFNALSHVAQYLARTQHAVCVETVVAEFRISQGCGFEGKGKGNVPVGRNGRQCVAKGFEDEGYFDYVLGWELVLS
jgi:hypothetical protein